ncbi:MAG TPA: hypothetical protein VN706_12110 [Gemmatimonadaceae bacterium]|nr:hypothetical protein [Gemmatimonadaceae bacterium]
MKSLRILIPAVFVAAACTKTSSTSVMQSGSTGPDMSAPLVVAPSPDPRVDLKGGLQDAGEAIWNMRMVSHTPAPEGFAGITNSDLAFSGTDVIQGNYNGFQIWDISNPAQPRLRDATLCPASQSDVSVWKNLLFVSAEAPTARLDCGTQAPTAPVSKERIRGLRIFDISDISHPRYLANVQTCRGSHTHTVVHDPHDPNNIYVYISGTSTVRPAEELPGCVSNPNDPNTAEFRIEVIQIPLAHPEQAHIVTSPRIFSANGEEGGLPYIRAHGDSPADTAANRARADSIRQGLLDANAGRGGRGGRGRGNNGPPVTREDSARVNFQNAMNALPKPMTAADSVPYRAKVTDLAKQYGVASPFAPRVLTQCHDITVYPDVGLAGGACAGMGLLLDIHDAAHPQRIAAVADSNFSFWHSATFSNDGSMVLFSDEWGGGGAAYCRAGDPKNWGADAIFKIVNKQMVFQSYYKLPAPQTKYENCVAHNGSLIPIPGRTIMVQAWYQGGMSVFEWTDPRHPHEIAFFDRGPNDPTRLRGGGYWSAYWYNGHIIGSEMQRGLDVFELTPSPAISQNEIDAAKSVHFEFLNVQDQPKFVWPASFALSRSYTDQLERWHGLSADQVASVRSALTSAEAASGSARSAALNALAGKVREYESGSTDPQRVQWLAQSLRDLASSH